MKFIYPEKEGDPVIIHLDECDNSYMVLHQFLHNLYWVQNMDDGGYCYSDMIVVWDLVYDFEIQKGVKPYPHQCLFEASYPSGGDEIGWFRNCNDWSEGQEWIFIFGCYMFDDLEFDNGTFKGKPLDFSKVKGHECDEDIEKVKE